MLFRFICLHWNLMETAIEETVADRVLRLKTDRIKKDIAFIIKRSITVLLFL